MTDDRQTTFVHGSNATLSRRTAVQRLGAAGVAALLIDSTHRNASAQASTPAATPGIVAAWVDAWNSDDPATNLGTLYSADGSYEDIPTGAISAPGEVAGFIAFFMEAVSDVEVTLVAAFQAEGWAAALHEYSADNLGAFGEGAGRFTVRVATVFHLDGDLIRYSADYYDIRTILAQLSAPATPAAN